MDFIHSVLFRDVALGVWSAFGVDAIIVLKGQGWTAITGYDWKVASWRWFQGGMFALFAHFGISAVSSISAFIR